MVASAFAESRSPARDAEYPNSGANVVLPADRLRSGGVATLWVAENILLPDLARFWSKPRHEVEFIERIIARFDVRPAWAETLFGKLSGGNQQKAILAKWLALKPQALVLDDPTSGVDPGARQTIFQLLREAAANGIGVLVFSTEHEQLAAFCSRVLILQGGRGRLRAAHQQRGRPPNHEPLVLRMTQETDRPTGLPASAALPRTGWIGRT